jgi:WD40 repeat protein
MFAKAFRLFVSSTFQDFGEERRLLQERVFPALEAECAKAGFGFRAVDMRWGVNGDAQLNQRTADICLGEVVEAKGYPSPNLLILIGDRYGWVPLPFAIARDEFEAMRAWLAAQGQKEAVSDLDRVYALDENHLVAGGLSVAGAGLIGAYTLRSREDDLSELKAPEAWASVEALLRDALQAAARQLHASGRLRETELEKYTLSLTEQEIRNGLEQLTEGGGAAAAHAIAWVRTTDAAERGACDLAAAVERALPAANVLRAMHPEQSADYAYHFVAQITARLIAALRAQIAAYKAREQASDFKLQKERATHAAFAAERLRVFVGRESNLSAIATHIAGNARHPLVLTGISGSGKTALMARAAAETKGNTVQRFVGASASSANQRNLLISVIEDLVAIGVASPPVQWEDDDNRFVNQVRDLLSGLDQPVAIFIDALDQLRAPYRPMWLPPQLHPKVKMILSVLDDEAFAAERTIVQGLRRSLPAEAFLAIEPLSKDDGADILAGLKREAQRGLSAEQEVFILERFQAAGASPLYLRIAFAIARRWRSTEDPRRRELAGDGTALIGQLLDELSTVHHHETLLVRRALGLIAAGREGLSEGEAIGVLSRDADVMAAVSSERFGAKTDRLPDSVWVRLKRSLATLLVEKGEEGEPVISFFHRQVTEVVRARFYEQEKAAMHAALAAYFDPPAEHPDADPPWTRRGFVELPYQLHWAGSRTRLDSLLTDPVWIDRKILASGGVSDIVPDYERFANTDDPLQPLIGSALRLSAGPIARDVRQRVPQLHGRLLAQASPAFLAGLEARMPAGAIYETQPALTSPVGAELARLEGHTDSVRALAVLPDGRLASGSDDDTIRIWDPASGAELARLKGHTSRVNALAMLQDGRLASGSNDKTIRLWDPASGEELARLEGHGRHVNALAVLSDGRLASGSGDGTIRIWDPASGAELARLEGHDYSVSALAVLPNGGLASGSDDDIIRIWDPAGGAERARLKGHGGWVRALAVLPDGRLASGSTDATIEIWDPASGTELARLEGHGGWVRALAVLPDGRLASGSDDDTIRIWDPASGAERARLEGHTDSVRALAVLPNGRLASGADENTIRIWDVASGAGRARLQGHGSSVRALAVLPDGRLASGSDDDKTIRIWDLASGAEPARLEGHRGSVNALAALPDGRLASGSDDDKTIRIWDPASGAEWARLEGHSPWVGWVNALAVLPDGCLASGSCDKTIRIWDLSRCVERSRLEGNGLSLVMLPNGRLASGSVDGTIRIWDPTSGAELVRIEGNGDSVDVGQGLRGTDPGVPLAALPDGRLASGSTNKTIRIWDPASGAELVRLEGHSGPVDALAALPDGRLASGAPLDRTIRIWCPNTGAELARLEVDAEVGALALLPDGRIAAGDALGRLHWLAIKRMEGRALAEPGVRPVGEAAAREDLPDTPPARLKKAPADDARQPRAAPPKREGRTGLWALVILVIALAAFAAATLGTPALLDLWSGR